MRIYFTFSQLPEVSGLSRKQRRFVWQRCIHPALTGRFLLIRLPLVCLVTILVVLAADYIWHSRVAGPIAAGVGAGSAVYITDMIFVAMLRPEIQRFVTEHRAEIAAVASYEGK
jgi:uncharacterized iron-regulated membrane protein